MQPASPGSVHLPAGAPSRPKPGPASHVDRSTAHGGHGRGDMARRIRARPPHNQRGTAEELQARACSEPHGPTEPPGALEGGPMTVCRQTHATGAIVRHTTATETHSTRGTPAEAPLRRGTSAEA